MPNDNVTNSNDKSTIVQSEADLVTGVIRHHRLRVSRTHVPPEDRDKKIKKVTKDNYYFILDLLIYYNFYRESMENHPFLDRITYSMSRETVMFHFHSLELRGQKEKEY